MEKRHIVYFVLVLIMLSGLAACVPANAADKPTPVPMSTLDAVLTPEDTTMPEETAPAEDVSTLLAEMAKADLAQRLGVDLDQIVVERVTPTEFSDTSLGVPEPGQMYAQVITPGYVITLTVDGESYRYHGAGERVVIAVTSEKDVPPTGDIAIAGGPVCSNDNSIYFTLIHNCCCHVVADKCRENTCLSQFNCCRADPSGPFCSSF